MSLCISRSLVPSRSPESSRNSFLLCSSVSPGLSRCPPCRYPHLPSVHLLQSPNPALSVLTLYTESLLPTSSRTSSYPCLPCFIHCVTTVTSLHSSYPLCSFSLHSRVTPSTPVESGDFRIHRGTNSLQSRLF